MKKSILFAVLNIAALQCIAQSNLSNYVFREDISTNQSSDLINPEIFTPEDNQTNLVLETKRTSYTNKQVSTIIKGLLTNQEIDDSNPWPINDDKMSESPAARNYLNNNQHRIKYVRSSLMKSVKTPDYPMDEEIAQITPLNSD